MEIGKRKRGWVDYVKDGIHMHKNIKNKMKIENSKDLLEDLCSEPNRQVTGGEHKVCLGWGWGASVCVNKCSWLFMECVF